MSMYLQCDTDDAVQVASNAGWSDICKWARGIDEGAKKVKHLCQFGWVETGDEFADDLKSALADNEPEADTLKSLHGILKALNGREEMPGVISVTDGMGA